MHVDHRGTNTVGRPWVAVPRRSSTRRTALAAALGLLVATLALPVVATPPTALAEDGPKSFAAGFEQDGLGVGRVFDIKLTLENTSPRKGGGNGRELGSANVSIADGASFVVPWQSDGELTAEGDIVKLRDLGIRPGRTSDEPFDLQVTGECDDEVTFAVVAKQSNDFQGAGNELTDQSEPVDLTVTLECGLPPYLAGLDAGDCVNGPCTAGQLQNGHRVTASATSPDGVLYAGFRRNTDDPDEDITYLAERFFLACNELVDGRANSGEPFRLAGEVAQVEPVGLSADDGVTVRMTIPRSEVNTDVNRSADVFTICFVGDAKAFPEGTTAGLNLFQKADRQIGNPDLFGPVLLPLCIENGDVAPCIESRQKVRADVELTVRIRASDPWMR